MFIPIGIGFVSAGLLLILGVQSAPLLIRYVTLQGSLILARVGIAPFIVSKIVQPVVSPSG